MEQRIRGRRLALAILLGLVLQYVMLLFSLHASLFLSDVCQGSNACYWLLSGLYMGGGVVLGLVLIPWSKWPLRLGVTGVILCGLGLFSLLFHT